MKFFNFSRPKSDKAYTQFDEHTVESNPNKPDIIMDKFIYSVDIRIIDVLHYIRDNAIGIGVQLNKPATDIEIENFEKQKVKLPEDFKTLYKFSNGFETDHDLFRLIPLDEIIESDLARSYLVSDVSFHFTEYMIYSDMWSVDISKDNINEYRIYNKTETVVYLTNSLAEFLCVFINKGIYDGLYGWREMKQLSGS